MAPDDTYHHGDLPNALRRAAADVIAEKGLGAFSLREVARRAGVSSLLKTDRPATGAGRFRHYAELVGSLHPDAP